MVEDWFEISWRELYPGWCCILSNRGVFFLGICDEVVYDLASIEGAHSAAISATSYLITIFTNDLKILLIRRKSFQKTGTSPECGKTTEFLDTDPKTITSNGGIALQMWCSNIAWLKRRLFNCVGKYPKEMELARRTASLEELFLSPN
jgi:hypothetical protein